MIFGVTMPSMNGPALSIGLLEPCLLLRPSIDPETPSEDSVVQGSITLDLPKHRRVKRLSISLRAHYDVSIAGLSAEARDRVISTVVYQSGPSTSLVGLLPSIFQKGQHDFAFSLIVPSSTGADVEKSVYGFGAVSHRIVAHADVEGFFGHDIRAEVPIALVANPASIGDTYSLTFHQESTNKYLGPYAISASAPHFTLGSLVEFSLCLPCAPQRTDIVSFEAYIISNYTISSLKDLGRNDFDFESEDIKLTRAMRKTKVFKLDASTEDAEAKDLEGNVLPRGLRSDVVSRMGVIRKGESGLPFDVARPTPMHVAEQGGSYRIKHVARVPNHYVLQPSTLPGTKTPLHVDHILAIELKFGNARSSNDIDAGGGMSSGDFGTKDMTLVVSEPIIIPSCRLLLQTLLVPPYPSDTTRQGHPNLDPPSSASYPETPSSMLYTPSILSSSTLNTSSSTCSLSSSTLYQPSLGSDPSEPSISAVLDVFSQIESPKSASLSKRNVEEKGHSCVCRLSKDALLTELRRELHANAKDSACRNTAS